MKWTSVFPVVVCGVLSAAPAHAALSVLRVTMTDLGTLGGSFSEASDVNDAGTIVGFSADSLGAWHGFYDIADVMYFVTMPWPSASVAAGINNHGDIVGTWRDGTGDHAFLWRSGVVTPLDEGVPFYLTTESSGKAIADNFRIVGQIHYPHPRLLGFSASNMWLTPVSHFHLYPPAVLKEFASIVEDVDELGRAAVYDVRLEKSYVVNHFGPASSTYVSVADPPPIAGYDFRIGKALGLHENNGVVGYGHYELPSGASYLWRAYYWNTTSPTAMNLPMLPGTRHSVADDINGEDLIVGWSEIEVYSPTVVARYDTAFIYHPDFGMYALPMGSFRDCHARALNERNGEGVASVVGWCEGPRGRRAVRWNVRIKGSPSAFL